ncbi:toprim domain-containing protein [Burkholderia pseudomallei]|uniref:toprim domain-containing protein n=1 Tax=Burkholderia pseudomallei TaxID=28450 RepID=UPI0040632CC8
MTDDPLRARSALFCLDAGCERDEWVRIGMAYKASGGDTETWVEWCATGANYSGERDARAVWKSIDVAGGITGATLFHLARGAGWKDESRANRHDVQATREQVAIPPAAPPMRATLASRWLDYWNRLEPPHGACLDYLHARKCSIPPRDGDLRCDPAARHPSGYIGPCLVAQVSDYLTFEPLSLHRTWICADGTKPNVDKPRRLLAGHRKRGGAIFLWPNEAVDIALGIGEGIETSLTLARYFRPVWSLIDAGNLEHFSVLPGIQSITICADNDPAGLKAATACAEHWAGSGCETRIVCAPEPGADINDLLLQEVRYG